MHPLDLITFDERDRIARRHVAACEIWALCLDHQRQMSAILNLTADVASGQFPTDEGQRARRAETRRRALADYHDVSAAFEGHDVEVLAGRLGFGVLYCG